MTSEKSRLHKEEIQEIESWTNQRKVKTEVHFQDASNDDR